MACCEAHDGILTSRLIIEGVLSDGYRPVSPHSVIKKISTAVEHKLILKVDHNQYTSNTYAEKVGLVSQGYNVERVWETINQLNRIVSISQIKAALDADPHEFVISYYSLRNILNTLKKQARIFTSKRGKYCSTAYAEVNNIIVQPTIRARVAAIVNEANRRLSVSDVYEVTLTEI